MKDRIATKPGRHKMTDEATGNVSYVYLELADEAVEEGTDINKALLDPVIAATGTTEGTATALTLAGDGGFTLLDGATIRFKLHTQSGASPTINVNGTGAKALNTANGLSMPITPAGAWVVATYSSTLDFFVLASSTKAQKYTPALLDALMGYSPLYEILEASI